MEDYREKLVKMWELSAVENSFTGWLTEESFRKHKKSMQMAGDLAKALARVGELESELKNMVSGGIPIDILNPKLAKTLNDIDDKLNNQAQ